MGRVTDNFAARARRAEGEKGIRHNQRVTRGWLVKRRRAQQDNSGGFTQIFDNRFWRVRGGDVLDQRAHRNGWMDEWIIGLMHKRINGKALPDNPFSQLSINPEQKVRQTPWAAPRDDRRGVRNPE